MSHDDYYPAFTAAVKQETLRRGDVMHQGPDKPIRQSYKQSLDDGGLVSYRLVWNSKIPELNDNPPTQRELISVMNHIRERALEAKHNTSAYVEARREVIHAVAEQIENHSQGVCLVDHGPWYPHYDTKKGEWVSSLHVFLNEACRDRFLAEED